MENLVLDALFLGICIGISFATIILIIMKTKSERIINELEERNNKLSEIIDEIGKEMRKNGKINKKRKSL